MKYIRTEDGIDELSPLDYEAPMCLDGKVVTCVYTRKHEWIAKSDILKQAKFIDELCDCFVYWFNESDKPIIAIANEMGYVPHCYTIKQIYGAIWTDKGLIYVAKTNDKGELELL